MELGIYKKYEKVAFCSGLCIRLLLIFIATPLIYSEWFIPFLTYSNSYLPEYWNRFLDSGGEISAFPYGPIYLIALKPLTSISQLLGGIGYAYVGLGLSILLFDFLLYKTIKSLISKRHRFWATYTYWLSPIVIYCSYWHGQLDVLPVLILVSAIYFLSKRKYLLFGLMTGLAVSAKFVMVIAVPMFVIYLIGDRRQINKIGISAIGFVVGISSLAVFSLNEGFRRMVFGTKESLKAFDLQLIIADDFSVYLVPATLLLLIYGAWRVRRIDLFGLINLIGLAFFILYLLTPASAGWAIWTTPFIALHLVKPDRFTFLLSTAFSISVVLLGLMRSTGPIIFNTYDFQEPLLDSVPIGFVDVRSLLFSVVFLAGIILCMQMLRRNIFELPFHRNTRSPMLISIAGDSGAGKDTLSDSLIDAFGTENSIAISGDNYHLWDRKKPIWRALTHLNPQSNDLDKFEQDVLALKSRQPITARHYDHHMGRMTKPLKQGHREVIVSSGLHSLFSENLRQASNIKIFLDMDEELRRHLKIERDVNVRGHSLDSVESSILKRLPDAKRYIQPQIEYADLILKLQVSNNTYQTASYSLETKISPKIYNPDLERYLLSLGGLEVRRQEQHEQFVVLTISGESDDLLPAQIVERLAPNIHSMLALAPRWMPGITGIMQTIVLCGLEKKLFYSN